MPSLKPSVRRTRVLFAVGCLSLSTLASARTALGAAIAGGTSGGSRFTLGLSPGGFESAPERRRLKLDPPVPQEFGSRLRLGLDIKGQDPETGARPAPLWTKPTVLVTSGVLIATPIISYFAWWRGDRKSSFTFARENWFSRHAYAGGADKASHIFVGYVAQNALTSVYERLGHSRSRAGLLALGVTAASGLLIEAGDGFSQYGAAWEDFVSNTIGAFAAYEVDRLGLSDTVGFRMGFVKALIPDPCCRYGGYGSDYSREIYSLDLKLSGFLPRIGVGPGLGRFLLVSLTYGSKGYRYSPPESRQRNIGIDLGLNLPEILRAVGVKDSTWWGRPLLTLLQYFRVPYTAFGIRYDMNSGKVLGPDTGDRFNPGTIYYD